MSGYEKSRWRCWIAGGHGFGEWRPSGYEIPLPRRIEIDADGVSRQGAIRELVSECWRCGHQRKTHTSRPGFSKAEDWPAWRPEWSKLADYNGRRNKGILHDSEYMERMERLQGEYDAAHRSLDAKRKLKGA